MSFILNNFGDLKIDNNHFMTQASAHNNPFQAFRQNRQMSSFSTLYVYSLWKEFEDTVRKEDKKGLVFR